MSGKFNQKESLQNMINFGENFFYCFEDTDSELRIYKNIFADPITYVLKNYPECFYSEKQKSRLMFLRCPLPSLEAIYYRDTERHSVLQNKKYYSEADKPQQLRSMTHQELIVLRGCVKRALFQLFTQVRIRNSVEIKTSLLPDIKEMDKIGAVGVDKYE